MCISEEGLVVGQKTGWDWVEDLKVRSLGFSHLVEGTARAQGPEMLNMSVRE